MRNRHVDEKIYTKDYYLKNCFGFEEFQRSSGKETPQKIQQFLKNISIKPGMKILDIGCGRGDLAFYLARKGTTVIAIDYATAAIEIAKEALKKQAKIIQKHVTFHQMDAKILQFKDNTFDAIVSVDVFEHLFPEELDQTMKEIKRVLKPRATLLVHTEPNVVYLNFTHHFYTYPMSCLLIFINKLLTGKNYPNLPKDPRNDLHKKQHVNEPTILYLKKLFKTHNFTGNIDQKVSGLKPILSWKDKVYNYMVWMYPFCLTPIGKLFFAYDYLCVMNNNK